MRVLRKIMALTLALTLVLSVGAMTAMAGDSRGIVSREQRLGAGTSSITLTPQAVQTEVGSQIRINAVSVGVSSIAWKSNNPEIVKITASNDSGAAIEALAAGQATITASVGDISASCTVTVVEPDTLHLEPGDKRVLNYDNFENKSTGEVMENIGWRFSNEYLAITKKTIVKGGDLINEIRIINDDKTRLDIEAKQNYTLEVPEEPNLVISEIELTVKRDDAQYGLKKGDVYKLRVEPLKERIGYDVVDVPLDNYDAEYIEGKFSHFVEGADGKTSGKVTYSESEGMIYLEGTVKAGDRVFVSSDNRVDRDILNKYEEEMRFYNLHTSGFTTLHDIYLTAEPEQFVYRVQDGFLLPSGLTWSDKEYAWMGKISESVSYVVSDGKLEGAGTNSEMKWLSYYLNGDLATKKHIPGFDGLFKYDYTIELPTNVFSVTLTGGAQHYNSTIKYTGATRANPVATAVVTSADGKHSTTYTVTFIFSSFDDGGSTPPPIENPANKPETTDKVNNTVAALKDPTKELPKDVVKTTTAGGASITTIPVTMTSGNASLGTDIINTIGNASANVGLKLTVNSGISGGSMDVIIPGGFGKITEPGRFSYPMDYNEISENSKIMTTAVKERGAVSMTAKVGGNFTLPIAATVTVPTKIAEGSEVNIYKYDFLYNKFTVIGKAVVKDGKLTFATKIMGEMLFTTGTV